MRPRKNKNCKKKVHRDTVWKQVCKDVMAAGMLNQLLHMVRKSDQKANEG